MKTIAWLLFSSFTASLGFSACSSGDTAPDNPNKNSIPTQEDSQQHTAGEQDNGMCPSRPSPSLRGTKAVGITCQSEADCAPTCCSCPSGGASWLGAACISGVCQSPSITCDLTAKGQTYCSAPVAKDPFVIGKKDPSVVDKQITTLEPKKDACNAIGQWQLSFTRNSARSTCQDPERAAFSWNVEVTQATDAEKGFFLRAPSNTTYVGNFQSSSCTAEIAVVEPIQPGASTLVQGFLSLAFAGNTGSGMITPLRYQDCKDSYLIQLTKL